MKTLRRNQLESLSGIETKWTNLNAKPGNSCEVEINLNPYQGLKQKFLGFCKCLEEVEINLNPYQGLKLVVAFLHAGETPALSCGAFNLQVAV